MSLLITGVHRSGTSAAARIVAGLDFSMGQGPIMGPAPDNPRGFYERADIAEFNDRWLAHFGGAWWAPVLIPEAGVDALTEDTLTQERNALHLFDETQWFVKDPRAALLMPLWDRLALSRLPTIVCVRDPLAVADSLRLRNGFQLRRALTMWARYTSALLAHSDRPTLVLDYDRVLEDPGKCVRAIADFVGVTTRSEGLLASTLEPGLRRSHGMEGQLPADCQALHDVYQELRQAHGQSVPSTLRLDEPAWVQEFCHELTLQHELVTSAQRSPVATEGPDLGPLLELEQAQVHALTHELDASREHTAELAARFDLEQAQGQTLAGQINDLTLRLEHEQAQGQTLAGQINDLTLRLEHEQAQGQTLAGQINDLTLRLEHEQAQGQTLARQINDLTTRLEHEQAQGQTLARQINDLSTHLEHEQAQGQTLAGQINDLTFRLQHEQAQGQGLAGQINDLTLRLEHEQSQVRSRTEELAAAHDAGAGLASVVEHERDRAILLEAALADAKDQVLQLDALLVDVNRRLQVVAASRSKWRRRAKALRASAARAVELEREVERLTELEGLQLGALSELTRQQHAMEEGLALRAEEVLQLRGAEDQLRQRLGVAEQAAATGQQALVDLQDQVARAEGGARAALTRAEGLEREIAAVPGLRSEMARLEDLSQQQLHALSKITAELDRARGQVVESGNATRVIEGERDLVRKELGEARDSLAKQRHYVEEQAQRSHEAVQALASATHELVVLRRMVSVAETLVTDLTLQEHDLLSSRAVRLGIRFRRKRRSREDEVRRAG